jgi:hypothetical protein
VQDERPGWWQMIVVQHDGASGMAGAPDVSYHG